MFFKSSPDLWFKVVDAIFDENKVFSESSRFRLTVLKLNSNQLEIVGDLLHGFHPRPYFEMKRLLTQTYGITDQQRYVSLTKMTLGSNKPSTLLRKMKSTFRGERLTNAMSELLRDLFLQALPKSVKLHLVGESNSSLDNLVVKADAIFLELFPSDISTVTSPEFIPSTSSTNKTSGSECFNLEMFPICAGII